jgi:hypothetical protein
MKLVCVEILTCWQHNQTRCSMICEENKNFALRVTLKDRTACRFLISLENGNEIVEIDVLALVIDRTLIIDIDTRRVVKDFTWERVIRVLSNVIVDHKNYLLFWNTIFLHNLISVVHISLVSIIPIVF